MEINSLGELLELTTPGTEIRKEGRNAGFRGIGEE